MTKNEYLNKYGLSFGLHQDNDGCDVLKAMDEYGQQETTCILRWISENGYKFYSAHRWIGADETLYSHAKLAELYWMDKKTHNIIPDDKK